MNYHDIKKYLEGQTTTTESEQIRNWLINSENDVELRQILGEIWTHSEIRLKGQSPNFNRMLDQVHHQINNQQIQQHKPKTLSKSLYQAFSKVAAILVIPLLLLSVYFYFNPSNSSNQLASNTFREIYTKPGTRTQIDLPDGTRVWLNDGTIFRYPERFTGSKREVFVDGEAYFEVKSNPDNPFVVNNPMMNTVVTGTHFNLNAYSSDNYFEATLLEGKIHLENEKNKLVVKPGQQVQFDPMLENIIQKTVDPQDAAGWVDGKLIFKDERLGTAIKKLARWYNVEIILTDPEINNYLMTATIQDEKLDQSLKLIALALPVTFEFKKVNNLTEIQRIIYMTKR
ncbi:anti-sigma factor [Aquipluma nitroreducens]|uniref:Anti-sigma factor n=1 Tax=Aquipluma nitroreducens TaxID=2010828 RepID=A0A5K7SFW5_9BACT|nr:FecR domain-containing protein [Aquipluma nitroreducens]BBE20327.1 anti-sigma factor [Aquipluma nitroreducens]